MNIKGLVKSNWYIYRFAIKVHSWLRRTSSRRYTTIIARSPLLKLRRDIIGKGNIIVIGKNTVGEGIFNLRIRGNNNKIVIGESCAFGEQCSVWLDGNNCEIIIGDNSTFTWRIEFNAQENNSKIHIGQDCMFSNHIVVRTSDSHPIYSNETGERINNPKDVIIGNHVWIAPNVKIMKGANIGNGVIVGSDTTVAKSIPNNTLCVGRPAKIVKENIRWTRENLFQSSSLTR